MDRSDRVRLVIPDRLSRGPDVSRSLDLTKGAAGRHPVVPGHRQDARGRSLGLKEAAPAFIGLHPRRGGTTTRRDTSRPEAIAALPKSR
jgi:hypothetical protein